MAVAAGEVLSHYRLVEEIGKGGMGVVWRARDTRLERDVALKFLPESLAADPRRLAVFEHEAKIVAALNHPNIVTIHAIEEVGRSRFLTMELVAGRTLRDLIPRSGMTLVDFLKIAVPIAEALAAAHARGITHRDLKPRNVMVADDGQVKVLDFGLAKSPPPTNVAESSQADTQTISDTGRPLGTVPYMSPEQIQGLELDPRSDVFSLGILLYEMSTGRRPFRGGNSAALIASILRDRPGAVTELNPELPRQLSRIIERCLEKEPERRPCDAAELREQLGELRRRPQPGSEVKRAPSIAVLPFVDMSQNKDQDHFCEGIAEEILNALTRVGELRVVSRTSSFQFKNTALDSREIGDRLGVSVLLAGSVRKAGQQLRITTELINVADGCHVWSERYDRELRDVFAIQDEIAQNIVNALRLRLSPRERRALKQVATADVEAYEYYLKGRRFYYQYRRKGIDFALQMFSRAIELDPSYAQAYAGIADCCAFLYTVAERSDTHRERAEAASLRALELDPELAEAHASRGVVLSMCGDHEAADASLEEAIRLNPRLFEARYFHARSCFAQGHAEKAIRRYEEAVAIRPDDYQAPLLMAQIYDDLDREAEAQASRRRGVTCAERHLDLNPDDVRAWYMGGNGLVALGENERGMEWARRAREIEPDEPMMLYNVACIYSMSGQIDEALGCLERAVEFGFCHTAWLEHDSNLDAVRKDTRYGALLASIAG